MGLLVLSSVPAYGQRVLSLAEVGDGAGGMPLRLSDRAVFGTSIARLGDLDGDGLEELLVGAFGQLSRPGSGSGAAMVLFVDRAGDVKHRQTLASPPGMTHMGSGFAPVGDLDNDGRIDVVATTSAGLLRLAVERSGKLSIIDTLAVPLALDLSQMHAWGSIASVPDVTGDGIPEVLVGRPSAVVGGVERGVLWMLSYSAGGSLTRSLQIGLEADWIERLEPEDRFGESVAVINDLDGDGTIDFAVGSRHDDTGGMNRGAVWILFMNPDMTVRDLRKIGQGLGGFEGPLADGSAWGGSLSSPGDIDGDGTPDLVVGASQASDLAKHAGEVWVLLMNPDGSVRESRKMAAESESLKRSLQEYDRFGYSQSPIGDIDGNGVPDIAVAAGRDDDGGLDRGALYLIALTRSGGVRSWTKMSDTAGGLNLGVGVGDEFGASIQQLGDINGDGLPDYAIGAPGDGDGSPASGAIWIVSRADDGMFLPIAKISGSGGALKDLLTQNSLFGSAVAFLGDVNADGAIDLAVGAPGSPGSQLHAGAVYIVSVTPAGESFVLDKIQPGSSATTAVSTNRFGGQILEIPGSGGRPSPGFVVSSAHALWWVELGPDGRLQDLSPLSHFVAGDQVSVTGLANLGDIDSNGEPDLMVSVAGSSTGRSKLWLISVTKEEDRLVGALSELRPNWDYDRLSYGGLIHLDVASAGSGRKRLLMHVDDGLSIVEVGPDQTVRHISRLSPRYDRASGVAAISPKGEGDSSLLILESRPDELGRIDLVSMGPWYRDLELGMLLLAGFFAFVVLAGFTAVAWWAKTRALRHRGEALERGIAQRTDDLLAQKAQIEEQAEELRRVSELKSRFLVNISHEFRTPLTLILGPVRGLLRGEHGEIRPETAFELDRVHNNASRLLRLINQLLDLSRLESGSIELHPRPLDIVQFCRGVTAQFEPVARERGIDLRFQTSTDTTHLSVDPDRMEKVLVNLLSNALKFTPVGGEVSTSVERSVGGGITIRVSDTGIGISREDLPRVFDRFFQVDGTATRKYDGTGVGLSLVKELVELHHGTVTVRSRAGRGTDFEIHLPPRLSTQPVVEPRVDEGDGQVSSSISMPVPSSANGDSLEFASQDRVTILVAEDNSDLRAYVVDCFGKEYSVITAEDGPKALEAASDEVPDLIILDVMMPEMDGFEVLEAIRTNQRTSHIPVIMLTARADPESRLKGIRGGADAYLAKPFDGRELRAQTEALLRQRTRLQERYAREFVALGAEADSTAAPTQETSFVLRLREVILDHLSDPEFGVDSLAEILGMSRRQVYRKIKGVLNDSPGGIIRTTRLETASRMLREQGELSVKEIAWEVGFRNPSHFSRAFREVYGQSPTAVNKAG